MIAIKPDGRKIQIKGTPNIDPLYSLQLQGIDLKKDTIIFLCLEMSEKDIQNRIDKILNPNNKYKNKGG